MARIERQHQTEQEAALRAKNFKEVSGGFTEEAALLEASRCLNCKNHPCVDGCPVGVQIPEFIAKIKARDYDGAAEKILETSSLPAICGRVCPQESQCEKYCIRNKMEGAVSIGGLERFVADKHLEKPVQKVEIKENGFKAAVVGSGPSALACAFDLRKAGFDVTIFEAFHKMGGVLIYGIPEFRLPKDLVEREIQNVLALGVKVRLDTVVGKTVTMDELVRDFDAVYIGSGAGLPSFLGIEGENLRGVCSANEYLTRVNLMKAYKDDAITPVIRGTNAVICGGGNVAMDAARTALRLGANTTIVYRRGKDEMPARREEVRHAEEEGVKFMMLTNPVKCVGENGKISELVVESMELGEPDASGRRRPVKIEGSEHSVPCDLFIVAVGTSPNPIISSSCEKLETTKRGTLVVNEETLETTMPNVYAGGDAVTGAATVILAMGAGRRAARSIIEKLVK